MKRRSLWIAGILVAVICSFIFTESFRHTLARRRALEKAERDLASLDKEVALARERVQRTENDPGTREALVRKELGYLRPGEKEIRFLPKRD